MPKNGQFWRLLKTWNLRSKGATRQVIFNKTKIGENAKIENFKYDIFGYFQTLCPNIIDDRWIGNLRLYENETFLKEFCTLCDLASYDLDFSHILQSLFC